MRVKTTISQAIIAAATGMLQPFIPDLTPTRLISAIEKYNNEDANIAGQLEQPLTVAEACRLLKVSRPTIYRLKERGEIRFTKVGRGTRIPAEDIRRLISAE